MTSKSIDPNPTFAGERMTIHLDLSICIEAKLILFDLRGKLKRLSKLGSFNGLISIPLATENLSNGMYYFQLVSENGANSNKIVSSNGIAPLVFIAALILSHLNNVDLMVLRNTNNFLYCS